VETADRSFGLPFEREGRESGKSAVMATTINTSAGGEEKSEIYIYIYIYLLFSDFCDRCHNLSDVTVWPSIYSSIDIRCPSNSPTRPPPSGFVHSARCRRCRGYNRQCRLDLCAGRWSRLLTIGLYYARWVIFRMLTRDHMIVARASTSTNNNTCLSIARNLNSSKLYLIRF